MLSDPTPPPKPWSNRFPDVHPYRRQLEQLEYVQDMDYKANTDLKAPKYKFGEEVPHSVTHSLLLDKQKGLPYDKSWQCAIDKEPNQLRVCHTFRTLNPGGRLSGFQRIPYHLVFDVKFDLRKKAHLGLVVTMPSPLKRIFTPEWLT